MKRISVLVTVFSLLAFSLAAFPKYTDKQSAIELAKALDKGMFGNLKITSTYVLNDSVSNYYISAILSDGSHKKWYLNDIIPWVREDHIRLGGNKSLIFLNPNSTQFNILEKNEFHRMALKAKYFRKTYPDGDPLAGQTFNYSIKSFNLIAPEEKAFGRDENKHFYHYIFDLSNGTRELLTYPDAYVLMKNEGLLEEEPSEPVFDKAYHINKIVPHPKKDANQEISQFGVEIVFEGDVALKPVNFPFEIYEKTIIQGKNRKRSGFVVDVTIPNTEKKYEINRIKNLEYLSNVQIIKDHRYPKRLLLRSFFDPDVMNMPPVVTKLSPRSVYVTFFHVLDQTVYSRSTLLDPNKRMASERRTQKKVAVQPAVNNQSEYGKAFLAGVDAAAKAKKAEDLEKNLESLKTGIEKFSEASLLASNDEELLNALKQRNELREKAAQTLLLMVKAKLDDGTAKDSKEDLMKKLEQAEEYTRSADELAKIAEYKRLVKGEG